MSEIEYTCEGDHALDFDRDYHCVIGHLESFKILPDVTLEKDINVGSPVVADPGKVAVAGLITFIAWGGGPEDPMEVKALITAKNRASITNVVHKAVTEVKCKLNFTVFDYDTEGEGGTGKWFETFSTKDADIDGTIATTTAQKERLKKKQEPEPAVEGAPVQEQTDFSNVDAQGKARLRLVLSVKSAPFRELNPHLYEMNFKLFPSSTVQSIHFLTSALHKLVKDWGVPTT
jgi:hypothetical protein